MTLKWTVKGLTVFLVLLMVSCADEKAVNAAFFQNKVSWYVFHPEAATGVDALVGFDQPISVAWKPASQAVFATDMIDTKEGVGAAAVSGLGLLLFDDSSGILVVQKPTSEPDLKDYRTGPLFQWDRKTFVTLYQEPTRIKSEGSSASLAWWGVGNRRLAFYPLPSQVKDPARQAVEFDLSGLSENPAVVNLTWKFPVGLGWGREASQLVLTNGTENILPYLPATAPETPLDSRFEPLQQRLVARLGDTGSVVGAANEGHLLLLTVQGWAAVMTGGTDSRLYHLPEIGSAGRYTRALALKLGYVIAWETRSRGYVGAAGLVYIPYAVLTL